MKSGKRTRTDVESVKIAESSVITKSSVQKGDILERIVETLCADYNSSKVQRNVTLRGKSGVDRQIDVLIHANYKAFDIKIIVEAKNYNSKVGIEIIDSIKTKLSDVSGNLGVVVCPLGFTEGAIKAAELHDIQLFQAFDQQLGNTTQLIPLRYIEPFIQSYQIRIAHGDISGGRVV